ncbi:hypothetical protein DL95DRAFT_521993 [Leptodontidium sp. 2 PMI_412]|nr:hypothetical protein DL95DRAFT_521993 [Leptodontidium sp. 2 PMI_412]
MFSRSIFLLVLTLTSSIQAQANIRLTASYSNSSTISSASSSSSSSSSSSKPSSPITALTSSSGSSSSVAILTSSSSFSTSKSSSSSATTTSTSSRELVGIQIPPSPNTTATTTSSSTGSPSLNSTTIANTTTSKVANVTGKCCFVVQDTVSEQWWAQTSLSSTVQEVNLTSYITYYTNLPNITTSRTETLVLPTNASFTFTYQVGRNPLTGYTNKAPGPTEVTQKLEGTALMTAGVAVKSPAAFYVYNTVKVITVDPVTDKQGNVQCAATSTGAHGDVFNGVNSNAEAYFGGLNIETYTSIPISTSFFTTTETITYDQPTEGTVTTTSTGSIVAYETIYLNGINEPVNTENLPTGTMIALQTPFIYQPERGEEGADGQGDFCRQGPDTEAYGYVPQRVLDYLVENQNPELASCLPAGPSIIQASRCELAFYSTTAQQVASDLTSSATIYVGNPVIQTPSPEPKPQPKPDPKVDPAPIPLPVTNAPVTRPNLSQQTGPAQPVPDPNNQRPADPVNPPRPADPANPTNQENPVNPPVQNPNGDDPIRPFTVPQPSPSPAPAPVQPPANGGNSIGAIINSMFGNPPPPVVPGSQNPPNPDPRPVAPVVIPAATTIPIAQAPPGAVGSSANIGGTPVVIIPGPTTIAQLQPGQAQPAPQPIIIPAATTVPAANAPAGALGSVVNIGGTPFLVIPGPTTIQQQPGGIFPTSIINGTPFLAIPGPTSIPVANAPPGLTGTTQTIDGVPFLVIPGPTNIPAPAPAAGQQQPPAGTFPTTVIDGVPFLVVPGPTSIPVANAPPGLTGATTTINGTPFLVIPSPTNVPAPASPAGSFGTTTVNGTPFLVIPGPTSIPLSNAPAGLNGQTTTINGTPFLVIPSPTNVPAPNPGTGTFSTTTINNTPFLLIPGPTSIPLSLAPAGLQGSTTTLNGTPFLIIPSSTSLQAVIPGQTVISGTSNLVILGPTTMPVNPSFSVSGQTMVISGTTMVVVSGATTVPVRTSTGSSGSLTTSSRTSSSTAPSVSRTSTSKAGAAPTGVWMGGLGVLAGGVVMAVL